MLQPTWDMGRSTILYTCNKTGLHNVSEAIRYGVAAYDWSNAKELWANAQPMDAGRMLTKQAELVLAADPGIEGEQPRVWVYREHTTTAYSLSIRVEVWVAFFSRSDDHRRLPAKMVIFRLSSFNAVADATDVGREQDKGPELVRERQGEARRPAVCRVVHQVQGL